MHHYSCLPHVAALGVCDVCPDLRIGWPHDLVDATTGKLVSRIRASAGFDGRTYCTLALDVSDAGGVLEQGVCARVDAWAAALAGAPRTAALAPVLSDYADALYGLGDEVVLTYPNGRVLGRATFVGVDVWGRATARLASGEELEFSPEQLRLEPASR